MVGSLGGFYAISSLVGYFIAKSIFIRIISSISNNSVYMSTQFNGQNYFYFKLFGFVK